MPRILLAEDDQFIAGILCDKFLQEGFEVTVAADGKVALDVLRETPPDLVILDLVLPEVDGIVVLKFIRSESHLRAVPVLVLSNSAYFSGLALSAWDAGATHFVRKGEHSPAALVHEVRRLLGAAPEEVERAWDSPPPLPPRAFIKRASGQIRVLVVDDDRVIQGMMGFFMEQAGFLVRSAFNGRRALEMAEEFLPHIMVLDGMMPEFDGFTVLKIWQRHPTFKNIPVIMLSAAMEETKRSHALETGAVEYLVKPFSPDRLVAMIKQYVGAAD